MEIINTIVRKWGNSLGIVLPKKIIDKQKIKEGAVVSINIQTRDKTKVKDIFGILKFNKPTDEIMKEVDEELWEVEK